MTFFRKYIRENIELLIIFAIYFFGIIFFANNSTKEIGIQSTPFVLGIVFLLLIYDFILKKDKKVISSFLIIAVSTFLIELIGVRTGFPFGSYFYQGTLGIELFEVPILIGINWICVIFGVNFFSQKIHQSNYIKSLFAGLLATIFDFILEPVAIKLHYWQWTDNIIPVQNYISWFVIAVVINFILNKYIVKENFMKFGVVIAMQLVFFIILRFLV